MASSQRIIAILLLASYGLVSACGDGLHMLVDGSHWGTESSCAWEGHHSTPESPAADHSDCLICQVVDQGQLPILPMPAYSEPAEIGHVISITSIVHYASDRLLGDPRAPPVALV